jgi:N-acetylneuraminate synthase/N,N'-diacetyllegionaminate synthase
MAVVKIGRRQIGDSAPVYVIAELGVNHDGSPARALELVEAAASAGADAVKFQLFRADLLMSRASRLAVYQKDAGESDPVAMLQRLELPAAAMRPLVDRAHALGIHAIVTVFSLDLVGDAETLPWDAYKTASPDVVHRPLLDALAATGRPLIVSTGAAELDEVRRAVSWLAPAQSRLALLQCVSSYPTPTADAALGAMAALRALAPIPVGYSDHTTQVDTGAVAADLGADLLEKHFTLDKHAPGPDHAASLEPGEFRRYAELARDASTLRLRVGADPTRDARPHRDDPRIGPPEKRVLPCERDVRAVSRQSIVMRRALRSGETLGASDLTFKRPGTGLEPWRLPEILGRRLSRDVAADEPLPPDALGARA